MNNKNKKCQPELQSRSRRGRHGAEEDDEPLRHGVLRARVLQAEVAAQGLQGGLRGLREAVDDVGPVHGLTQGGSPPQPSPKTQLRPSAGEMPDGISPKAVEHKPPLQDPPKAGHHMTPRKRGNKPSTAGNTLHPTPYTRTHTQDV